MSSDSTRQALPYSSCIKTSKLLESSPYLHIDAFLTHVSVSTCTINVVSERITIPIQQTGIRSILAQDITENITVAGEVKNKILLRANPRLSRKHFKPLFFITVRSHHPSYQYMGMYSTSPGPTTVS